MQIKLRMRRAAEKLRMRPQKLAATIAKQAVVGLLVSLLLVLGGIGVILLIQTCMLWRATSRRRTGSFSFFPPGLVAAMEGDGNGDGGLGTEALQKLPCYDFVVEAGEARAAAAECAVCLESFEASEVCRLLPACAHSFHAQCVDTWLMQSPSCPVCRTPAESQKNAATADGEN